ncbi:MAG TPA: threonine/serine dehydratase [Candidatus Udaeobacter sp.]|nr:threonine/serine dehydratase [Candidatus Udaeobacter sp.]
MNSSLDSELLPTVAEVEAAARRIGGRAVETPLLEWPALNERIGGRVLVKPEQLQRTGSFKFRGAFNKLSCLAELGGSASVVAYSSGNHAQGVAAAAQLLGFKATIVMPSDAPAIKIANTRSYGAEVVLYDRQRDDREAIAEALAAKTGATIVRPYEDADVISGQGTVGLELARQARARGAELDAALIPCGGGGLIAGSTLALQATWPRLPVFACEPEGFDDTGRSLAAHRRLGCAAGAKTVCDGLMAPIPGRLTFALNDRQLAGGIALSDGEVFQAMAYAFQVLKLVLEPSGAVALAALLSGKFQGRGLAVGIVCSGGNVDPEIYAKALDAVT